MEKSYDIAKTEEGWYKIWVENNLFKADNKSKKPPFSMILPPPNVTGSLHMGHALTFTIPDIIIRRKKMEGYNTLWLPGVDHAGIATQMIVEKNLKKENNQSKEEIGRDNFLKIVWDWKDKSEKRILQQVEKLGLALDWSRMKFTLSKEMEDVVTKVFVDLYREKKIYRGTYMVNYCPSCKTVLSDLEVDHREVNGKLTYIKYPLKKDSTKNIIVATTRPETMLGDTAVAVNPDDERYSGLIGEEVLLPLAKRSIKIISDNEVSREFGTGAVKITPAHDPLDYSIALRHGLEHRVVIDQMGNMTGDIPEEYIGMNREECRKQLTEKLREKGLIEKEEEHIHNVGHCQRCETAVEPNISRQWFLKTAELAKPSIEVVEKKRIEFIPEKWEKVYFNWMNNIQDWCISRQLWWGHRIPAFYCRSCNEIIVQTSAPEKCTACGSTDIIQDPDVLDTWFSSALWPFSTLGWNSGSDDFKTFYPTSLMATGFDIIFFWVARMVMMGIHFGKDIPFSKVLINGLIRDEKGQKMSKTKNNVIDPLDIIEQHGTDALRFTLAIQAVPGMDISLSLSRIKGYKAFVNKIWNASRFVIMNLKGDESFDFDKNRITIADKWILHYLNMTIKETNTLMDNYRINEAADLLYHFFWHEYCDWYLEFSKNDINNRDSRSVLKYTLFRFMQLFHPFMPFITEEIYQKTGAEGKFLLNTEFPQFRSENVFTEEYLNIELVKKIITETRKTRTENKIDPGTKLNIFLKTGSEKEKEIFLRSEKYFNFLTKSSKTEIVPDFSSLPKGFRGVLSNWEILLPFENDEDREKELERLKKEFKKTDSMIISIESKLSNENFTKRAPEKIVNGFKKTLQESIDKKTKIEKTIKDLS
ncbi:MAG: valine--tRNA ligase [Acidobacteriota bacterium]